MSISNSRQISNILILGAGELGMAMLNGFVKEKERRPDVELTVLLRPLSSGNTSQENLSRNRQLEAWGVDIVTADFSLQSEQELATVFARYDAVINCSGFVGGKGTQLKITRAVLLAGVARYFPWQFGVDYDRIGMGNGQPVWDEQLAVRSLLRAQQRTNWVIVSTGMFTSYLFDPGFGVVERELHRVNAPGSADYSVTLTTPEDIGQLTAKIFFQRPLIDNEIIYIAGDSITYRQLAELLGEHDRYPYTLVVEDHQALQDAVAASPESLTAAYRLAFARADGVSWDKTGTYNARQGIEVTDVRRWLKQHCPDV
ncbi:Branched-chain amino acid ABC-type transport system, permease components [Serratia quinivorans]|uniref:aromatic alcohol reductase n=1 Tax=Serratia quinivorans TaxID=137545 RepID=UPI00217794AF|nr:aromatic alcohol reductase [Serratia quinivorans]CAI1720723.1 Branched-chain amino acid ABC-type transport system, permease components [Serratia quinivorans]